MFSGGMLGLVVDFGLEIGAEIADVDEERGEEEEGVEEGEGKEDVEDDREEGAGGLSSLSGTSIRRISNSEFDRTAFGDGADAGAFFSCTANRFTPKTFLGFSSFSAVSFSFCSSLSPSSDFRDTAGDAEGEGPALSNGSIKPPGTGTGKLVGGV